eukprot:Skav218576  [mRNA]  locus=scaffold2610:461521:465489:- [translate_table: standard]
MVMLTAGRCYPYDAQRLQQSPVISFWKPRPTFPAMKLIILILQLCLALAAKYRSSLVAEPASLAVTNQTQVPEGEEEDIDHMEPTAGDDEDPAPTEDDAQDLRLAAEQTGGG